MAALTDETEAASVVGILSCVEQEARDVHYWHKADIPSCTAHVRYWVLNQSCLKFIDGRQYDIWLFLVRQVATGINDTEARVVDISLQPFTN